MAHQKAPPPTSLFLQGPACGSEPMPACHLFAGRAADCSACDVTCFLCLVAWSPHQSQRLTRAVNTKSKQSQRHVRKSAASRPEAGCINFLMAPMVCVNGCFINVTNSLNSESIRLSLAQEREQFGSRPVWLKSVTNLAQAVCFWVRSSL